MNNDTKKKVFRSVGILALGALLMGGGVFLWQNEFKLSLFSSASAQNIQAIISLGEKASPGIPLYATAVANEIQRTQSKIPEVVSRAEEGSTISSLRDQAVLGYNDITKPITDHVVFVVVAGKNTVINGIKAKDTVSTIATRVTKEVSSLIDLASARPGVFPEGYTVLLATLPDPLDGTGDTSYCKGLIPNYGMEYTKGVLKEVNAALRSTASIYPLNIKIVDLEKAFVGHGLTGGSSWFTNCATLNDKGMQEASALFVREAQNIKQ